MYLLDTPITGTSIDVSHGGTFIGRFAAGEYSSLGVSPSREPGFYTTANPRKTLSGQVVEGAGGITGRKISVDVRYKIDRDIFEKMESAYQNQISRGFPFFILFDKEYNSGNGRFPWARLYGQIDPDLVFQSSVNYFLYSKKYDFVECF